MNALKDTTNNIITRRIHAVIRGSLAQFANSGSESASWTSVNGRMSEILGITDLLQGYKNDNTFMSKMISLIKAFIGSACHVDSSLLH